MPIYIYSLPKAGTYFFAAFLKELGFEDTGLHIDRVSYLDTHTQPIEVNARRPSAAKVRSFFVPVVRALKPRQVAFGHFPLPMHYKILAEDGLYVCAYRDPRRTLVSEFIDFRFRREDVRWLSSAAVADDQEAFVLFLKKHGLTAHLSIFREIVLLRSIVLSPLGPPVLQKNTFFVNFDEIRADPDAALPLAAFVGAQLEPAEVRERLSLALAADTKTRATDVAIDRAAFWTPEAEALYAGSAFPSIRAMAEDLGLTF